MNHPFIIGIAGGSGSGKTHFQHALVKGFGPEEVCIISQDNYYLPIEAQKTDDQGVVNFDLPEAIDHEAFYQDIWALQHGENVSRSEYTFNNEEKEPERILLKPAPIIIVEGIFALYYEKVSSTLDLKLFVDAPDFLMMKRRILRDGKERGYDLEDVLYRYEHHVMPAYQQFVYPSRKTADFIIPNESHFNRALDIMTAYIRYRLTIEK
jgi:uridine kinase